MSFDMFDALESKVAVSIPKIDGLGCAPIEASAPPLFGFFFL